MIDARLVSILLPRCSTTVKRARGIPYGLQVSGECVRRGRYVAGEAREALRIQLRSLRVLPQQARALLGAGAGLVGTVRAQ